MDVHANGANEALNMKNKERGSSLIEFTLVGIPLIFLLISTVEMARGMWIYHTLAYAIREGTRFVAVKGQGCATSPSSCAVTVGRIAEEIRRAGIGLDPEALSGVTFKALSGRTITCATLQDCLSDGTQWPSSAGAPDPGAAQGAEIEITATYPFRSALSMLWPGAGKVKFGTFSFPVSSREAIQF
jgi:hypothetical protein